MNIVFVNPPQRSSLETYTGIGLVVPPLGLAYIAAILEQSGHSVRILDAPAQGLTLSGIKEELSRLSPDVVGITATTPTFREALDVSLVAKEACPKVQVVLGGPHVSFTAQQTLRCASSADVICVGEGEHTFFELILALESGKDLSNVKGIAYKDGNAIRRTPHRPYIEDLDSLPFPARHLLPMDRYRAIGRRVIPGTILTSRGCPFKCVFCASSQFFGKTFRYRSPENVVQEVEALHHKYNARDIEFLDDLFTFNRKRVMAICQKILDRGLNIRWVCSSRVDKVDRDLLKKLKETGCAMIYFGVESGSQRVLNLIKKGTRIEQSVRALNLAREMGIATLASFIFGIPGETLEDMELTIKFAKKLNPDYAQFSIATPYPGTELYEIAKNQEWIVEDDWSKYTVLKPILVTKQFTVEDLKRILFKAYKRFYLRPTYIIKNITKAQGFLITQAFRTFILPRLREH